MPFWSRFHYTFNWNRYELEWPQHFNSISSQTKFRKILNGWTKQIWIYQDLYHFIFNFKIYRFDLTATLKLYAIPSYFRVFSYKMFSCYVRSTGQRNLKITIWWYSFVNRLVIMLYKKLSVTHIHACKSMNECFVAVHLLFHSHCSTPLDWQAFQVQSTIKELMCKIDFTAKSARKKE